jgi:hypothetical protein
LIIASPDQLTDYEEWNELLLEARRAMRDPEAINSFIARCFDEPQNPGSLGGKGSFEYESVSAFQEARSAALEFQARVAI